MADSRHVAPFIDVRPSRCCSGRVRVKFGHAAYCLDVGEARKFGFAVQQIAKTVKKGETALKPNTNAIRLKEGAPACR